MVTRTQQKWDQQAIHFPHSSFSFNHKSTEEILAQTKCLFLSSYALSLVFAKLVA
jgi:hypothetical protein